MSKDFGAISLPNGEGGHLGGLKKSILEVFLSIQSFFLVDS